jgi:hypothetical protein
MILNFIDISKRIEEWFEKSVKPGKKAKKTAF